MALPAPLVDFDAVYQPTIIQATPKLTTIDLIGGIKCHLCHFTIGTKKEFDSHYISHNTGSPNIVYTCVVCDKEITGYPSFRNHCYSKHVVKDRFKCKDCSRTFSKHSILQQHIATVHTFVCATCKKQFPSKKELQMHQITHKSESPPYDCQTCKQPIQTVDDCEDHIDQHCSMTYSCPICNEAIPDKNEATDHLTKHFGEVPMDTIPESNIEITEESSIDLLGGILCCFCSVIHKTRAEFDMHFAEHHPDKDIVYSCNICGKQYDKYHSFGDHCYYHYSKDRFECDECDKSFSRLSSLVLHTAAAHAGAELRCAQCGRAYASEARLRAHLRDKHGQLRVRCAERGCGIIFDTPKDLIYHQAVHKSGNRCQHCGLQFASMSACERHIPVHRKKQYSCPVCTRSYAEKYLTMKHIQTHFSSVLHLCKVCGKIFNAKNRLMEHIKVHSEVRNFKCTYCGKGFVKPQHLSQHLNIHTGMKPYQCTMCPKTFASYPNYHKHMRRIHNVSKVSKNDKDKNEVQVMKTNNNNNLVKEDFVDSTSSEMDMYSFIEESDESLVESDGIDPVAMNQESMIFEATNSLEANIESLEASIENQHLEQAIETDIDALSQFVELLPVDNHDAFVAAVPAPFLPPPQEYGPDFGKGPAGFIDLDEPALPHIDPLLTIKPYVQDYNKFEYENYEQADTNGYAKWEPFISKVFSGAYGYDSDGRVSVMNTDIY
ncbi:zinc finger protein 16-like [Plodia interpunctella]|uniref:zinc finger protein 16-like n=1 Tax=Plodia interpunctella TaxID=58824 RepID=UPI002368DEF8|nr:zinc finger protein 16-like [Plodia interpunctella]